MRALQVVPGDVPAIAALANRVRVKWPEYVPPMDVEWVQELARVAIKTPSMNYARWVAGPEGRPLAAIWAAQNTNLFGRFQKSASLMSFISEDAKAGLTLLKGFLTWVDEQRFDYVSVFQETGYKVDKFNKVLTRYGFSEQGTVLQRYNRNGEV